MTAPKKYVLDTNLFIKGFRNAAANARLIEFHRAFAPFEYLHSVVVQELRAGAVTDSGRALLDKHILNPFIRRERLIVPSFTAWQRSGEILRTLAREEGLDLRTVRKSFGNDILIAASCREAGITVVTDNARDFRRIQSVFPFEFQAAWPGRV